MRPYFITLTLLLIFSSSCIAQNTFKAGDKVEVRDYDGSWLPAQVLETDPAKGYKIHYINWDSRWDTWVGSDRIKKPGGNPVTNTNKPVNTQNTNANNGPEMNGSIPKIVGTAWTLVSLYYKGATPNSNYTSYPYIFGYNGRYEAHFSKNNYTMGKYRVDGNQLIQIADGSDRLTETYTIKWNATAQYLELVGIRTITRLVYNRKAAF